MRKTFQGLIVNSRRESLQHFKKPWAHDHEPVKDLLGAVKVRKILLTFVFFKLISGAYFSHTSSGYQANCFDWVIWSWKNFYEGNYRDSSLLQ